ncbi:MAG: UDP-N-acetyl-D-mannosamine dehydrogenase [Oceanospirillaceae bacterium]|nr:UDP-N-acetyl-D-mannosamine dehydrogenase [Oceanospirillaceae bacterium]
MSIRTVSVIGLGYIGLPTAAVLASSGVNVIGVDVNEQAVEIINRGDIHIVEPDLDQVVRQVVSNGKLRATTQAEAADAFMVAVPTPFTSDRQPDLSYIQSAAQAIAPVLSRGNLVVLESTSPVGATEKMSAWLAELRPDLTFPQNAGEEADVLVAHCPERVLPGHVLRELVENDRVIGGMSKASSEAAIALYRNFVKGDCLVTNARTAEMAKLTENSFRDVNIAFSNELSIICDELDINVWELIQLANRHPRVNILNPGPGVGGHCIAVDPWFIVSSAPESARLIRTAREINDYKPEYVVEQVARAAEAFKEPVIACLGLSYKADIDDLRESPAVDVVAELAARNTGKLLAVEPNIDTLPTTLAESGVQQATLVNALAEANILLVLVDHMEFKQLAPEDYARLVVIDTRGLTNAS